jgi:hypothetical protein
MHVACGIMAVFDEKFKKQMLDALSFNMGLESILERISPLALQCAFKLGYDMQ